MSDQGQWGGQEFEVRITPAESDLEAQLNRVGADGWQLGTVLQLDGTEQIVLQREILEPEAIVDSEDV